MCKKIHRGGNAEQYYADKKYKEAVAEAVEACADDAKGQTCFICMETTEVMQAAEDEAKSRGVTVSQMVKDFDEKSWGRGDIIAGMIHTNPWRAIAEKFPRLCPRSILDRVKTVHSQTKEGLVRLLPRLAGAGF